MSNTHNTSSDREWGTSSLSRIYRHDTPGQDESFNDVTIPLNQVAETDPCWKGYQMVGMKQQDGKHVPNCVPEDEQQDEHIVKVSDKWRLVSKSGGRNLGTYDSKADAEKREREVQYFKHHESRTLPSFREFLKTHKS